VSLAEKEFMATPVHVGTAPLLVPLLVSSIGSQIQVRKRNGSLEPADVNKIVRAVERSCGAVSSVDPISIASKTIGGLYNGATTKELDLLSIQTAASLISEEPEYSKLPARLLDGFITKEVANQDIHSFSQSVAMGKQYGFVSKDLATFATASARKLNDAIDDSRSELFEYFGLRTIYDRYLLRNPETREALETPQQFFLRVACGLSRTVQEAIEFYRVISTHDYMPSSPTLFISGTRQAQMSSCYLLDSPVDNLEGIYEKYKDVALLSKFAGGFGLAFHRVTWRGSLIRATNGHSKGIVPWLKTLDSSVAAVNQGGKRKGARCVYLESWHADLQEFLELLENTGDNAQRTYNLNLSNWIPDLFMKRVAADEVWSLFDPKLVPHFPDLVGEMFEAAYVKAEKAGLFARQLKARDLYARMMKVLAETGNGWMTFKDACNLKSNQTAKPENVVHLSNLCTEITEVSSRRETAVCNLGSINLENHVSEGQFDFVKLARTVRTAVKFLERVIDINFYPIAPAGNSNQKWPPVGLGIMGLQDVFFALRFPFDAPEARQLSKRIQEEIYFHALSTSCALAEEFGAHPAFAETRAAEGVLQMDLWDVQPEDMARWEELRNRMRTTGLRNSLLNAIAPTATIASIVGAFECIEPQVSNLFKREKLSGDFLQINRYLVTELKKLGLWNEGMRNRLKMSDGSVQSIGEIPEEIWAIYRTVWEIPMRSLIDMAAERGAFVDQSQSLNLFVKTPNIGKLSSMYMYAWKKGLKTTYYLRSRPATEIAKTTVPISAAQSVACSLQNPTSCDACQ
jgi:ribonucleoside-diphosphate reductase alpha chain